MKARQMAGMAQTKRGGTRQKRDLVTEAREWTRREIARLDKQLADFAALELSMRGVKAEHARLIAEADAMDAVIKARKPVAVVADAPDGQSGAA